MPDSVLDGYKPHNTMLDRTITIEGRRMIVLTASIYSPRWGHDDTYSIELTRESMLISHGPRKSKCVWQEGRDSIWQGESLDSHLRNDSIYAPAILPDLLEHLWSSWRNSDLNDAQAQTELDSVIAWLNALTHAKPQTEFWRKFF